MGIVTGIDKVDVPVEVLVLSKSDIEQLLTYKDVLEALDEVWKAYGNGEVVQAQKESILVGPHEEHNTCTSTPTYLKKMGTQGRVGTLGIKWITIYQNPMPGIPKFWGSIIVLNQADNGQPFAIMDATSITNIHTASNSASGAKYLAKKNSSLIAMIGCGTEARTHLAAFSELFSLSVVKVYDIRPEAMHKYREEMAELFKVEVMPTASAMEAVEGADIICMMTTSRKPVVLEPWVPTGSFVAGIVGFCDLDPQLSRKADKWVVGYQSTDEKRLQMAGFGDNDLSYIYANMGQIATGAKPGRENDRERIVYTHAGAGIHDITTALVAYNKAVKQGVGTKIRLA
ncbi:ornithine cyclodeaminase family protein [Chloroflexota bacterium]